MRKFAEAISGSYLGLMIIAVFYAMLIVPKAKAGIFYQDDTFKFGVNSMSFGNDIYVSGNLSMIDGTARFSSISLSPDYVYDAVTKTYKPSKELFTVSMSFSGDYTLPVARPVQGQYIDVSKKGFTLYESVYLSTATNDDGGKGAAPIDGLVELAASSPLWTNASASIDVSGFVLNGQSYGRFYDYASGKDGVKDSWSAYITTPVKKVIPASGTEPSYEYPSVTVEASAASVPEPTSFAFVGLGASSLLMKRRRR